jgi:hypothetical protein
MIGMPVARLVRVILTLLAGHVAIALLYWALINVPESNAAMLALSALLALLIVAGAGVVQGAALLQATTELHWRERLRRAAGRAGWLVAAVAVWVAVSWVCGWFEARHQAYRGQIDAWFIAHGDWTNIAWLHTTIEWLLRIVRYVVGTSLAVALLVAGVLGGAQELLRLRWIRPALAPLGLASVGVVVALFFWLPWRAAWWRPTFLPPNAIEPVFGAVKLTLLAIVMHVGWALLLVRATRQPTSIPEPSLEPVSLEP